MQDADPPSPFAIDRDLLDRNLESKRQEGLCCPHCSQKMEWNLGPKTRDEILTTISHRALHETFIRCDKDECPSVDKGAPILRRISAAVDGNITVSMLRLENVLNELRILRDENSGLEKMATQRVRTADRKAQKDIEDIQAEMQKQLGEARAELEGLLAEIDRMAGVEKPEDRLAIIGDLTLSARQMEEVCRLANTTPVQVLENARAWAAKQPRR